MTTRNMTDVKWEEIRSNKKKGTIFAAMESVFTGVSLFSILYFCCRGQCFHQCKRVLNNISLSTSHGDFLHCITWNHFQLEFCQIKGVISNPKKFIADFCHYKGFFDHEFWKTSAI